MRKRLVVGTYEFETFCFSLFLIALVTYYYIRPTIPLM